MKKLILLLSIISLPLYASITEPHIPHNPKELQYIEAVLYSQRTIAQDSINKILNSFSEQATKAQEEFISFIKNPDPCPYPIIRDPKLSPEIIKRIENRLKNMGINPGRIHLKIGNTYSSETKANPDKNISEKLIANNPTITIPRKFLKELATLDASIEHEGTHLLEGDSPMDAAIIFINKNLKTITPILNKTQELIADGIPSIRNPEIAIQNYRYRNCKKKGRSPYDDLEHLMKSDNDTHPEDSSFCKLIEDILIAHFGKVPENL